MGLKLFIVFLSVVLVITLGAMYLPYDNLEHETVYVKTAFGCIPLEEQYTELQWKAKQDFTRNFLGYEVVRCG